MEGFCDRHRIAYEIVPRNGSWYSECPKCRAEGLLDTLTSSNVETLPKNQWTASTTTNKTEGGKDG